LFYQCFALNQFAVLGFLPLTALVFPTRRATLAC
jgi:hypothetical protein